MQPQDCRVPKYTVKNDAPPWKPRYLSRLHILEYEGLQLELQFVRTLSGQELRGGASQQTIYQTPEKSEQLH